MPKQIQDQDRNSARQGQEQQGKAQCGYGIVQVRPRQGPELQDRSRARGQKVHGYRPQTMFSWLFVPTSLFSYSLTKVTQLHHSRACLEHTHSSTPAMGRKEGKDGDWRAGVMGQSGQLQPVHCRNAAEHHSWGHILRSDSLVSSQEVTILAFWSRASLSLNAYGQFYLFTI